jgi:hypothetical protein
MEGEIELSGIEFQRRHEAVMFLSIQRASILWQYLLIDISPEHRAQVVTLAQSTYQQIQNGSQIFAEPYSDFESLERILGKFTAEVASVCGPVTAFAIEKWIAETYKTSGETKVEYAWRIALPNFRDNAAHGQEVAISAEKQNLLCAMIDSVLLVPAYDEDLGRMFQTPISSWEQALRAELCDIDPIDLLVEFMDYVQFKALWTNVAKILDDVELQSLLDWYRTYYRDQRFMPMKLPVN